MEEPEKPYPLLRRLLPFMAVAIAIAAIYDGAVFYSRWSHDRDETQARAQREADQAKRTSDLAGGDALKILGFSASPGVVQAGGQATLCYGVNEATTVKIEPPVENVYPALSHCVSVSPKKDTEYTLVAQDAAGHSASASLTIRVRR